MESIHIWLSVISALLGGLIAQVLMDSVNRKGAADALRLAKKDFDDTIGAIQKVHNELGSKMLEVEERLATHDFQINAKMSVSPKMRTKPNG